MSTKEMPKELKSCGGLVNHLGVNDSRKVEKMIQNGDEHAKLIYDAMALNVARFVGKEAATVAGDIEGIVLTLFFCTRQHHLLTYVRNRIKIYMQVQESEVTAWRDLPNAE